MKKHTESQQLKASEYWYSLTPMGRYEIMCKVEKSKSIVITLRRCIAYIIDNNLAK